MDLPSLLPAAVLGLALAADAFAVSLAQGVASPPAHRRAAALSAALWFGGAQAGAALLGFGLGAALAGPLAHIDHWIAFGILAALGAKLIQEGLSATDDAAPRLASGWRMAGLAVATSIDAVAAGLTLPTLGLAPLISAAVIGVITAGCCAGGVWLGARAGARLGGTAEILGGVVLIGVGVKALFDHGAIG